MAKKFIPMYGGKAGGKMSNGAGWGGETPKKKMKSLSVHRTSAKSAAKKLGY